MQEHRSTFYFPYWKIPGAQYIVPRLREFHANLDVLDTQLDELIRLALASKQEDDIEALQARDYTKIKNPSLLRFLADMRGEDLSSKQLRDDLMTFLIAGHETTAALLTWAILCLTQNKDKMHKLCCEIDNVLEGRAPTTDDIQNMPYLRNVRIEEKLECNASSQ
jgi:cytochrome P450